MYLMNAINSHTNRQVMYKKTVNLRYLSAKIKIKDKNGNLKMQINKKNRQTKPTN